MRLFLASYRFGAHYSRLAELVGEPGPVAVIANACDSWPPPARASAVVSDLTPLRRLGFTPDEVDLREYLARPVELEAKLADFPFVWVRGGNTFVLRMQLARSGADEILSRLLHADRLVYAGYSAGACVLAPSLHGLETLDDPAEVAAICDDEPRWDGMSLVDHQLVVHLDSATDPNREADRLATRYRVAGIPHWTLTDNDAVVVDGRRTELLRG